MIVRSVQPLLQTLAFKAKFSTAMPLPNLLLGTVPFLPFISLHTYHVLSSNRNSIFTACNVYISEGKNAELLSRLESVAATTTAATALANVFVDQPYHRTNFTLLSRSPESLAQTAVTLSLAALAALDLRSHAATHPRLGVVDHISCHPLSSHPDHLLSAASTARSIAQKLGHSGIPSFLYGAAHPAQTQLVDIRRGLGYFSASKPGGKIWSGAPPAMKETSNINRNSTQLPVVPEYGPSVADPRAGVSCIGAVPWMMNLNVLVDSGDMRAVREMAREVSERGGGLAGVQAMALQHEKGIEVACNLLRPLEVDAGVVEREIRRLAGKKDLKVLDAYCTGKTVEELERIGIEKL